MVFMPSSFLVGFSQMASLSTTAITGASLTTSAVGLFFTNLFYNPGANYITVMIMGGVVIAAVVGLAFLIKLVYDKYSPEKKAKT